MTVYISEYRLRQEIIRVTRTVAAQKLVRSSDGNISIRLDDNRFLVTPSGLYKMSMEADDALIVDFEGKLLQGREGLRPTSELNMHLEVYRQRPDVSAVLHAHPPYATALTIAGLPFPTDYMPEVLLALGNVPTAPYARPGTAALAESIREPIRNHNNILLSHHGSLSIGRTLEVTLISLERMEAAAYTFYLARALGQAVPLPAEELKALAEIGAVATAPRKGDF